MNAPATQIFGWLALSEPGPITRPALVNPSGQVVSLTVVARDDVRAALPTKTSIGFAGWIDVRTAINGPWRLRYDQNAQSYEADCDLFADGAQAQQFAETKRHKLARIVDLLRCPLCHSALRRTGSPLTCDSGHPYGLTPDAFDFLDDELRARIGAVATENVSAHGYDAMLDEMIAQSSGPIIDVGAGLRPMYRPDVINVEIVPYPTTDIISASEHLPFSDESIDLVISVAVLEHVRDPFAAARELQRVLRPGGRIFAAVPFLQPYHAYPNHYYNMTSEGLRNLFPDVEVESLDVPLSGGPIFALTWMLGLWRQNLPSDIAADFDAMTVAELAVAPMELIDRPFVRSLHAEANQKLAALNVLIGRKPV